MTTEVQCCNCHFLSKHNVNHRGFESTLTWEAEERKSGLVAEYFSAECAEGVWSARIDPHIKLQDELY